MVASDIDQASSSYIFIRSASKQSSIASNGLQGPASILIAAHEGDQQEVDRLIEMYRALPEMGDFQMLIAAAWAGYRDEADLLASKIDKHHFGAVALAQATQWCGCGSPFNLDATPNFAAKLEESGLRWSPPVTVDLPLKDW